MQLSVLLTSATKILQRELQASNCRLQLADSDCSEFLLRNKGYIEGTVVGLANPL